MIRVRTGSRLHFGFFHVPGASPEEPWPNADGKRVLQARHFGGVGLMIEEPAVQVHFEPGKEWSAEGPLAERALAFARRIEGATPGRLVVEACPPEHHGLGVGTQLGLAVARAVTGWRDATTLARLVGRGKRSALGIHGFALGGFLVEGGKRTGSETIDGEVAPLIARHDFPGDWRIVLVLPSWGRGLTGTAEQQTLQRLAGQSLAQTEVLCRLVLLGMLPALVERDLPAFGEALYDFNRRVGEVFRPVQGGTYGHLRSEEIVTYLTSQGIAGIGQSSWGPGLFAVVENQEKGEVLEKRLRKQFQLSAEHIRVTRASNQGAQVLPRVT